MKPVNRSGHYDAADAHYCSADINSIKLGDTIIGWPVAHRRNPI